MSNERNALEVLSNITGFADQPDEHRTALVKRLAQVLDLADVQRKEKAFKPPPGITQTNRQIGPPCTALECVRDKTAQINHAAAVNRPLREGDIPGASADNAETFHGVAGALLDHIDSLQQAPTNQTNQLRTALDKARNRIEQLDNATFRRVDSGLTEDDMLQAPRELVTVVHYLAGVLLNHIQTLSTEGSAPGAQGDFTRFLASELSLIYTYAARTKPTRRTDWNNGKTYGPFYDFVAGVLKKADIRRPGADHIVRLATDHQPDLRPIRIIG